TRSTTRGPSRAATRGCSALESVTEGNPRPPPREGRGLISPRAGGTRPRGEGVRRSRRGRVWAPPKVNPRETEICRAVVRIPPRGGVKLRLGREPLDGAGAGRTIDPQPALRYPRSAQGCACARAFARTGCAAAGSRASAAL